MGKKILKGLNKVSDNKAVNAVADVSAKAVPYAMMVAAVASMFTGYAVEIADLLVKVINLVYGFCFFAGILSVIIGIVNVAGAMGEEGGQDPQKLNKGKGAIIRGAILVAIPTVLTLLGIDAEGITEWITV